MESWGPFAEGQQNMFQNQVLRSVAGRRGMAENFHVFGFELRPEDMAAIATSDRRESSFFDHRDPTMVKRLSEVKLPIQGPTGRRM
jgi:2,5-diketo-D-gluconate reductase A